MQMGEPPWWISGPGRGSCGRVPGTWSESRWESQKVTESDLTKTRIILGKHQTN
jgi:hypothetical protein